MKRSRFSSMSQDVARQIVEFMEEMKHNDDTQYIDELHAIIQRSELDGVYACEGPSCWRYCDYHAEAEDQGPEWQCHVCFAFARPTAKLCFKCMPQPFPCCTRCRRYFCPNCTAAAAAAKDRCNWCE